MKEKLAEDIKQLRDELMAISTANDFSEKIQSLNAVIDQLEKDAGLEFSLEASDGLNQAVASFEIEHPKVHALIRSLMKTLGDIGV